MLRRRGAKAGKSTEPSNAAKLRDTSKLGRRFPRVFFSGDSSVTFRQCQCQWPDPARAGPRHCIRSSSAFPSRDWTGLLTARRYGSGEDSVTPGTGERARKTCKNWGYPVLSIVPSLPWTVSPFAETWIFPWSSLLPIPSIHSLLSTLSWWRSAFCLATLCLATLSTPRFPSGSSVSSPPRRPCGVVPTPGIPSNKGSLT